MDQRVVESVYRPEHHGSLKDRDYPQAASGDAPASRSGPAGNTSTTNTGSATARSGPQAGAVDPSTVGSTVEWVNVLGALIHEYRRAA
jgi:hypothetical protein